jgi:hypothetical protein
MTPLYDAVVETVEKLATTVNKDQPALVVIMTDGQENSSTLHDQDCLKDLIGKLKEKNNWTFTFMGANQDSWATAMNLGIDRGNIMNWSATSKGSSVAFANLATASINYMSQTNSGGDLNSKSFFSGNTGGEK